MEGSIHNKTKKVLAVLSPSVLIILTLFLFLPHTVYQGNIDEFTVPFTSILGFFLFPALILVSVLVAIGLLLPGKLDRRYISILFILGVLIWLQANVLVWKYGLLDGQSIDWTRNVWHGWVDGALWILLLVMACLFYKKIYKIAAFASIILISLQLVYAIVMGFQKPEIWKSKERFLLPVAPPQAIFQFSSKQNVIHVILDQFQSDIFQEIIDEEVDHYYTTLEGFTFFKETTGSFPTTKMSIPAIFSGQNYQNDIPMSQFISNVLKGRTISNVLYDRGYEVDFVHQFGSYSYGRYSNYYKIPILYGATKQHYVKANSALMLDLVLFRSAPHILKRVIYNNQLWLIQPLLKWKDKKLIFRYFAHKAFLQDLIDNMSVNRSKPVYKFIHLLTSHGPFIVNEDCEYSGKVLGWNRKNIKIQQKCALEHFMEFLNKLKLMGIYESSLIIVHADHGAGARIKMRNMYKLLNRDSIFINKKEFTRIVGAVLPLMAIKPPYSKGALKISKAQVALTDIPATISSILYLNETFNGKSVFEIGPNEVRERKYYYCTKNQDFSDGFYNCLYEYNIKGSVFDGTSWRLASKIKQANRLTRSGFSYSMRVSENYNSSDIVIKGNQKFKVPVILKNTGKQKWVPQGEYQIRLAYHWRRNSGQLLIRDGIRSCIPHDLAPGDEVEILAVVKAPNAVGEYILEFDLVQEHVAWFGSKGAKTLRLAVAVR
jgi:hypothetical protein